MDRIEKRELSVLVVGFNSACRLDKCFTAIKRAIDGLAAEVLFINNGLDNSEAIVRARFPWVRIVESRGNIGFAAANNHLARGAVGRYLLLVNPDTEIEANSVKLLLSAVQGEPQYGILGGTTLFASEPDQQMSALKLPTTLRLFRDVLTSQKGNHRAEDTLGSVEATSGGFMFLKHELWRQLGGMDERFFLYAEDLDLCKRAAQSGTKTGAVPGAKIWHDVGSGSFYSRTRQLYLAKGNATYQWKHCSAPLAITNIALIWLRLFVRALGAAILAPVSGKHFIIFKALAPLAMAPWRWVSGYPKRGSK